MYTLQDIFEIMGLVSENYEEDLKEFLSSLEHDKLKTHSED